MTFEVPEGVLDVVMIAAAIFAVCAAGVVGYWELERRRISRQRKQNRHPRASDSRSGRRLHKKK
jgi:hypothetical protein